MSELFDTPACESPRLKWIKKHKIQTHCSGKAEDFDGEPWNAWQAESPKHIPSDFEIGATEDDAIAAWTKRHSVLLWNEENL